MDGLFCRPEDLMMSYREGRFWQPDVTVATLVTFMDRWSRTGSLNRLREDLRPIMLPVALGSGVLALGVSGCYHATIDPGRSPSGATIHNDWAHSFVYGLVPPSTVSTASECPSGVARVETQMSFLNGLVSGLTFGLYTPMTITVQCAGAGAQADLPAESTIAPPPGIR